MTIATKIGLFFLAGLTIWAIGCIIYFGLGAIEDRLVEIRRLLMDIVGLLEKKDD